LLLIGLLGAGIKIILKVAVGENKKPQDVEMIRL